MTSKPTGTVTFLFTDIENSTKLAREYPEIWEAARARYHTLVREAIQLNNGFVFQVLGDAFCAAFHKAGDSLKAAIKAQQYLQNEPWGEVTIYMRMGIHTGEAEIEGQDYRGYTTLLAEALHTSQLSEVDDEVKIRHIILADLIARSILKSSSYRTLQKVLLLRKGRPLWRNISCLSMMMHSSGEA